VVGIALDQPELTPRELAWHLTDTHEYFISEARVHHKPRLLSDNGPSYISKELREWLQDREMKHTRGAPYHPMTQGKIEHYHRSMKNVVMLEHYYFPWELESAIAEWVAHYNHERYHESLDNVTPADVYNGRRNDILDRRSMIKSRTLTQRKVQNLRLAG
jgi:putative transposase